MQYDNYLFCYFHSENYLLWTNKVLFDSGYLVTIKWLAHLHISVLYCSRLSFSKHTPSKSCVKPVVAFHCRLCPLALLFGRENPGSQALPLLLSFRQHHLVPGSHFSPGCPVLLWLHHDLVPQWLLGHMSCMSTSRFVRYCKMDQAAKDRENLSSRSSIQERK